MPVNDLHPEYAAALPWWKRRRDLLAGEDAVKAAGEAYLAGLDAQSDTEFAAYVKRASFFNATARTSEGFVGIIFRREVITKLPGTGPMVALVADVDMAGGPLYAYAKRVVTEVIAVGRAGTRVDCDDREGRVYFADYKAEDILNWRKMRLGGRSVLSLVEVEQIRVLKPVDG